jgi:hypothetical protein
VSLLVNIQKLALSGQAFAARTQLRREYDNNANNAA